MYWANNKKGADQHSIFYPSKPLFSFSGNRKLSQNLISLLYKDLLKNTFEHFKVTY